jgi:cytochrome c553
MKKPGLHIYLLLGLAMLWPGVFAVTSAFAQTPLPEEERVRGALLYDDWMQVKGVAAPSGNHPIWGRQSSNTRSGPDTWRCVSCHGWDYQGKDGAWSSGADYTGFPGVYAARNLPISSLVGILQGAGDPEHDFSAYLSPEDRNALAVFIREGLVDDNQYIDRVSRRVIGGNVEHGKALYEQTCATCHGDDGLKITFRYEGMQVSLATLAVQDPWRFLHRTRFGVARAPEMPIGATLGWTAQDGRDVLAYAQGLAPLPEAALTPALLGRETTPAAQPGGPAQTIVGGILTALGAITTGLGFALLLGALLVGILLVVVWIIRTRKS